MWPFLSDVEYLENVDQANAKSYQVNSLMNLSSEKFIADNLVKVDFLLELCQVKAQLLDKMLSWLDNDKKKLKYNKSQFLSSSKRAFNEASHRSLSIVGTAVYFKKLKGSLINNIVDGGTD